MKSKAAVLFSYFFHVFYILQEITDKFTQKSNLSESPCLSEVYVLKKENNFSAI